MTDKHREFCWEYVSNGYNAIQAYRASHPDATSIGGIKCGAYRYMKDPEVKEYIKELLTELYEQKMISADTIATELAEVAFQRRETLGLDYNEGTKLKALELLQKQLGLQTTNQRLEAKVEQVMFVEDLDD